VLVRFKSPSDPVFGALDAFACVSRHGLVGGVRGSRAPVRDARGRPGQALSRSRGWSLTLGDRVLRDVGESRGSRPDALLVKDTTEVMIGRSVAPGERQPRVRKRQLRASLTGDARELLHKVPGVPRRERAARRRRFSTTDRPRFPQRIQPFRRPKAVQALMKYRGALGRGGSRSYAAGVSATND
jgi:hypothetical protein